MLIIEDWLSKILPMQDRILCNYEKEWGNYWYGMM